MNDTTAFFALILPLYCIAKLEEHFPRSRAPLERLLTKYLNFIESMETE